MTSIVTIPARAKTTPAEQQVMFASGVWVKHIMQRPSDCWCTWIPSNGGFALKARHKDCPAKYRHG